MSRRCAVPACVARATCGVTCTCRRRRCHPAHANRHRRSAERRPDLPGPRAVRQLQPAAVPRGLSGVLPWPGLPGPARADRRSVRPQVSDWSEWGLCSVTCGNGIITRQRTVVAAAANGGLACPSLIETHPCYPQVWRRSLALRAAAHVRAVCVAQECPVDCVMSSWGNWSSCSASCGGSARARWDAPVTKLKLVHRPRAQAAT